MIIVIHDLEDNKNQVTQRARAGRQVILMSRLEVHKSKEQEKRRKAPARKRKARENGGNKQETIGEVVFTIQRESTATKNKSYVCTKNHVQSFPVQLSAQGPKGPMGI